MKFVCNEEEVLIFEKVKEDRNIHYAEVFALLRAMRHFKTAAEVSRMTICTDSKYARNILNGTQKTRDEDLKLLLIGYRRDGGFDILWIPRYKNIAGIVLETGTLPR